MTDQTLLEIFNGIVAGNRVATAEKIRAAIDAGLAPEIVLERGMIEAMAEVGRLFGCGEYYVPEMLMAARAMQAGLDILKPYLVQANVQSAGKVVLGTVRGDLHDIGKNLVCIMLQAAGFEITDLGTDVSAEKFIAAIRTNNPQVVGMSSLLTTTMPAMQATMDALATAGLRGKVKVIIGGAPVTEEYARKIGADGYARDAGSAVELAKKLVAQSE